MYLEERVEQLEKTIEELKEEITYLKMQRQNDILTPKEFAQKVKLNENTIYCWIREGRIKILPNLGTSLRIPMSQFYESKKEDIVLPGKKKSKKAEQLKQEFLLSLNNK